MSKVKFSDLYNYIQEADRDSVGNHYPAQTAVYPVWSFQIYEGRRQLNINRQDHPKAAEWPRAALIFYPEENRVRLVRCNNCIADYDEENYIPMDTELSDEGWIELLVDRMHTDADYKVVHNIQKLLVDTIDSWCNKKVDENKVVSYDEYIRSKVDDRLYWKGFTGDNGTVMSEIISPMIATVIAEIICTTVEKMTDMVIEHADEIAKTMMDLEEE